MHIKPIKLRIIAFLLLISFSLFHGCAWLLTGIVIFASLALLFSSKIRFFVWIRKKTILSISVTLIGIFTLVIFIRVFLIEICSIPSSSMEDTLLPSDKVIASKINYGLRMPSSPFEIPWINILFYLNKDARASSDSTWYEYIRLKGYSEVHKNDVFVFNSPYNKKEYYVKRCIGLPGETLKINNGIVLCNGSEINFPKLAKIKYKVWLNDITSFLLLADSLKLQLSGFYNNRREPYREVILSPQQYRTIKNTACTDSLFISAAQPDTIPHTYPHNKLFLWTFENFGPVLIPEKGMQIELTPENYFLYKVIFDKYEGQNYSFKNNHVFSNEGPLQYYTFKQGYRPS